MTLKEKAARGLLWGSVSNGLQQLFNLGFGIALARLLSPDDYGMVGQLTIFSLIAASLQESGFTAALANRPTLDDRDYNAVFWFSLPMSLTLYALLFLAAPFIAAYYDEPELVNLSRYAFIGFVISGLGIAPSARLFKTLRVRERTIANLTALALSGTTGIALAYHGYAYWGIATQTLVYNATNTILYWFFAGWRPQLTIDYRPVREMFGFSSRLLLTNIISHLNNNFFSVIFGRYYSANVVGDYTQANKWNYMGQSLISGVVNGVAQPLLVAAKADPAQELRVFRKMLRFTAFLTFPLMLGISLIAPEFIVLAIGKKWLSSAEMLSIVCVSGAFIPITGLYTQLLLAHGRSNIYMWGLLSLIVAQLSVLVITVPLGTTTMLWVFTLLNILWLGVWHFFASRLIALSLLDALRDLLPFLLVAAGTMVATHYALAATGWGLVATLAGKILLAALLYTTTMWLSGAKIFRESLTYLLKKK